MESKENKCNGNCGLNYCDENGCVERKRVLTDPLPPQEVEAKEDDFILQWIKSTGRDYMHVSIEALRLLQELHDYHSARLRSSMGKVPGDERIEEMCCKVHDESMEHLRNWGKGQRVGIRPTTTEVEFQLAGYKIGLKDMRSEVAPYIAKLENLVHEKSEEIIGLSYKLDTAESELKQAKEALSELSKEAEDLMDFCIDRKYLDNEDKTDGQILFDTALIKAKKLLTPKKEEK